MPRARKRHVQQSLDFRADRRGGKREGAGRPPKGPRSAEAHKRRPLLDARHPLHVTLRVVAGLPSMRKKDILHAIGDATVAIATDAHHRFRIVHLSIQSNHLHMLVETASKRALSRGMQAFQISAAKRINAALTRRSGVRRRGQVFADRYHAQVLSSPRAVRHALCYVLNNWRRHGESQRVFARTWKVDPYSSASAFPDWKERESSPLLYTPPRSYLRPITWRPKTWLLREGWKRHGLISIYEVPGPTAKPRRR